MSLCTGCSPGVLWDRRPLAEAGVRKRAATDQQGDTVLVNHDPEMWTDCIDLQVLHHEVNSH